MLSAQESKLNQYMLAAQHDWGAKRGFFLILDNRYSDSEPSRLEGLSLALAVGDGKDWRYVHVRPTWEPGRQYAVRAVLTPTRSELWLDGQAAGQIEGGFVAHAAKLIAAKQEPWARGPADYMVTQMAFALGARGRPAEAIELPAADVPLPLRLFEQSPGVSLEFDAAGIVTIVARFQVQRLNLEEYAPFVDRYGQSVHAEWPQEVRSDQDIRDAMAQEEQRLAEWGEPAGLDRFGGSTDLGWREEPTGFFRVVQRDGFWWLITPDGNPCFYRGVCTAPAVDWDATPVSGREHLFAWLPPREGLTAEAWRRNAWGRDSERNTDYVCPHAPNLAIKYGEQWRRRATDWTLTRARTWGFSGLGKWVGTDAEICRLPVLHLGEVPRVGRHPDVFDPSVREHLQRILRAQIEPQRTNPWVVGWSIGNEYDAMVNALDVAAALSRGGESPLKRALVDHALAERYAGDLPRLATAWKISASSAEQAYSATPTPSPEDIEAMRVFWAERYMATLYETVKSIDPDHLYFGNWVTPNWWVNESDWKIVSRHCDVMGYDQYSLRFAAEPAARLIRDGGKPVLVGEFSFPPDYAGQRGYGRYGTFVQTEQEGGETYARYLADAARDPNCVGICWFQYRDQPLTGRGPVNGPGGLVHGEHFAFGLVDVTDRPKWPTVERMREANLLAPRQRQDAMAPGR